MANLSYSIKYAVYSPTSDGLTTSFKGFSYPNNKSKLTVDESHFLKHLRLINERSNSVENSGLSYQGFVISQELYGWRTIGVCWVDYVGRPSSKFLIIRTQHINSKQLFLLLSDIAESPWDWLNLNIDSSNISLSNDITTQKNELELFKFIDAYYYSGGKVFIQSSKIANSPKESFAFLQSYLTDFLWSRVLLIHNGNVRSTPRMSNIVATGTPLYDDNSFIHLSQHEVGPIFHIANLLHNSCPHFSLEKISKLLWILIQEKGGRLIFKDYLKSYIDHNSWKILNGEIRRLNIRRITGNKLSRLFLKKHH